MGFGDGLDVAQEFVEVAGLGVHFFLLWVTQNTGDILVGWLETKTTDEVTNLISFFISPSQSYGVFRFLIEYDLGREIDLGFLGLPSNGKLTWL